MRMTLSTRNVKGVVANLFARDAQAQKDIRRETTKSGRRVFEVAVALCPFDTGFEQEHLQLTYTEQGFGFEVGWDEADFIAAGLPFYPLYTEFGTTKMAAQPCLFPAHALERPRYQRNISRAVQRAMTRRMAQKAA